MGDVPTADPNHWSEYPQSEGKPCYMVESVKCAPGCVPGESHVAWCPVGVLGAVEKTLCACTTGGPCAGENICADKICVRKASQGIVSVPGETGDWCAPDPNFKAAPLNDFIPRELLDLPTISVKRGGIRFSRVCYGVVREGWRQWYVKATYGQIVMIGPFPKKKTAWLALEGMKLITDALEEGMK